MAAAKISLLAQGKKMTSTFLTSKRKMVDKRPASPSSHSPWVIDDTPPLCLQRMTNDNQRAEFAAGNGGESALFTGNVKRSSTKRTPTTRKKMVGARPLFRNQYYYSKTSVKEALRRDCIIFQVFQ
jgi:hypothetical protein